MPLIEVDYQGARLKLEADASPSARLYINNILRAEESALSTPCTLRLGSPVQTGYEWHEYIEARVSASNDTLDLQLIASNQLLEQKSFKSEREPE